MSLQMPFLPSTLPIAPARNRHSNRIEMLLGRSAALCVHPFAAWRSPSRTDRALLLLSYFAISYVTIFGLLHAMSLNG